MKSARFYTKIIVFLFAASIFTFSCSNSSKTIDNNFASPVKAKVILNNDQILAAKQGRLSIVYFHSRKSIPVQLGNTLDDDSSEIVFILPEGVTSPENFQLKISDSKAKDEMTAFTDSETKQVVVEESGRKILQYNYQMVYEEDVIRPESKKDTELSYSPVTGVYYDEYLKAHPELEKNDTTTSRIYSVPRSDYIHPLYGLNGEILTSDWPDGGHPHHRGIFWAWPEVEYGLQRGDIYALQRVFARPTGNIEFISGPVFGQIDAENLWMWEDSIPIVNEHAVIRVYRSSPETRIIDLTLKFLALKDSVTIATRFTNSYGGLNIRMQTPEKQDISYFTDEKDANPIRAWSDFNGIFEGNNSVSGMMVLQHKDNPEYPGEWRNYPDLAWVQPTFPTPNSRFLLSKELPLTLRYRLIVHSGGKPSEDISIKSWDEYNTAPAKLKNSE